MTFKTIVAVVQGEKDEDRLLDCVLPLANHFKSHVIGVHAEPMPVAYTTPMGFPDAEFIHISSERNEKRAAELGQRYSARCLAEGISGEWRSLESFSGDSALSSLASARCADLIVAVQSNPDGDSISSANLEGLLFEAGRPVLFVPYAASVTGTFRKVLIAWNGSREAARAVFDALPFIMDADEIEILVVDAEDDAEQDAAVAAADIAASLGRHGVHVTVVNEKSAGLSIGTVIENHAAEAKPDMIVMGAYSHSWLREFLFGGVTRTLLQSMPVPTFMSR
ncbi:Universal stress protein family protein [Mesorhizobium albiziae]|uniref:Universal stress protein family protein n=1 Tax=Neomesorhizobium albiziae TaxID=335020 RepID=A0A1I4C626_9HYPH|nr:universal stress protein [Mesorhizobium albiziae]GLS29437.1 universal stress protein [Mesorhizobium albiziae]SFK76562.1 Universal stress protein family protein [Mesorhizobium albiziae]